MSENLLQTEFNNEKRELIYSIAQWSLESNPMREIDIDISDLTVLFQIMGYKLEVFEKAQDVQGNDVATSSNNELFTQVQFICSKTGVKSKLTKVIKSCNCPCTKDIDNGQLWSVTGCAPSSSQTAIDTSSSSLIPTISKCKAQVIGHLIGKVCSVINDKNVQDVEVGSHLPQHTFLTRHRSLDMLQSKSKSNTLNGNLSRELSWEVDSNTSPPAQTSSPVPYITHTLGQISLHSDNKKALIHKLSAIKALTLQALELTGFNSSKPIPKKRVSDIKPEGVLNGHQSSPRKKATPTKRLAPASALSKCGIPTPKFSKAPARVTPPTNSIDAKAKANGSIRTRALAGSSIRRLTSGIPSACTTKYRTITKK